VEQMLLLCPIPEAREPFAGLLVHAISLLAPAERERYNEAEPVQNTDMRLEVDSDEENSDEHDEGERMRPSSVVVRFLDSFLALVRISRVSVRHWCFSVRSLSAAPVAGHT